MKTKGVILFVGLGELFSGKRACDTRLYSINQIFKKNNWDVVVLNRDNINYKQKNIDEKIKKINVKLFPLNFLIELKYIFVYRKKTRFFSLYSGHCIDILYYYLLCKIFNKKLIYHYVEYRSSFDRQSIYHKINGWLFDNFFFMLADGFITISKLIDDKIIKLGKPTIKIPPLFSKNNLSELNKNSDNYFAYCGSIDYVSEIRMLILAFLKLDNEFDFILVIGGDPQKIKIFKNEFLKNKKIKIFSKISNEDLSLIYSNAKALLLPLKDTIQNNYRFPQKISEYASHSGYIITNKVGDIPDFFDENINIIYCEYSIKGFSKALKYALIDEHYNSIKKGSYNVFEKNFNPFVYTKKIELFLNKI